jgi:hypothetical protein
MKKKKKVMTLWIQSGKKNHMWQMKMSFTGMFRERFFWPTITTSPKTVKTRNVQWLSSRNKLTIPIGYCDNLFPLGYCDRSYTQYVVIIRVIVI